MGKYLETNLATFRIEKGILHVAYKENVTIFLRQAMEIVSQRLAFQQGKAYPILCNIKGVRAIGKDARAYLAMEGAVLIEALALVYKAPLSEIFSKVYIKENPPIQTKMFNGETTALEFLSHLTGIELPKSCARDIE